MAGKTARKGQLDVKPIGPTEEIYTDPDAVQGSFTQQRGNPSKGDKRQLVSDNVLTEPVSGAKSVNKVVSNKSSFYGDE